jgi:hypothetical protein
MAAIDKALEFLKTYCTKVELNPAALSHRLSEICFEGFSQRLTDKQQLCLQVLTNLTDADVMAD